MNKLEVLEVLLKDVKCALWGLEPINRNITIYSIEGVEKYEIKLKVKDSFTNIVEVWVLYKGDISPLNGMIKELMVDKVITEIKDMVNTIIVK
ncbi:MAG: hypothetical protein ACRDBY_14385 [Cetobacterium sp.]